MKGLMDSLGHRRPVYLNRAAWLPGTLDAEGRPLVMRVEDWLSLYRPRTKRGRGLKLMLHKINSLVMLHYPYGRTFVPGPAGSRAFVAELFGGDPAANLVTKLFVSEEDWDLVRNGHEAKCVRNVWQARMLAAYALQLYLLICFGSTLFDGDPDPEIGKGERVLFY